MTQPLAQQRGSKGIWYFMPAYLTQEMKDVWHLEVWGKWPNNTCPEWAIQYAMKTNQNCVSGDILIKVRDWEIETCLKKLNSKRRINES